MFIQYTGLTKVCILLVFYQPAASTFDPMIDPFSPISGDALSSATCPGLYCGRITFNETTANNLTYTECQACPKGERPDQYSVCQSCLGEPVLYAWLYLGFMFLLTLILHFFFIDHFSKEINVFALHVCALLECVAAGIFTLLSVETVGDLRIKSCDVKRLSDWYTMFFNPVPDYKNKIHCTQEAVYPLYSMVFIFFGYQWVLMVLFRPILSVKFCKNQGRNSIYAALYFLPILVVIHAVCAGLIYYSFPFLMIVISLITSAMHFLKQQETRLWHIFRGKRNILILFLHWTIHAYGIISFTELENLKVHLPLLILVVVPSVFFILTYKFSDPTRILSFQP
ncbi:JNK1/MAPK8-associated membrane protein-like [Anneissia japonica]|uniref:JNK1/MAPK8-associated membrane protein-like n=1 Tax=Anneissia japonica TaxID=1529436 RepID=UPI0014259873|nr:JNK1/MAPK8-associated membrane protein-like [Anneissia japonica]